MTSNFSLLFLALQQRIGAILDASDEKVFRFIDHDLGFLDEDIPGLSYPAILIDMSNFKFSDLSQNVQIGEGVVLFKLVFAPYSATNNLTPDTFLQKGLGFYELEEKLHTALQGWRPSYNVITTPADPLGDPPVEEVVTDVLVDIFGSFDRTAARTDIKRKDLRIREVFYSIAFEDYNQKSYKNIIYTPATPTITEEIIEPGEIIDL